MQKKQSKKGDPVRTPRSPYGLPRKEPFRNPPPKPQGRTDATRMDALRADPTLRQRIRKAALRQWISRALLRREKLLRRQRRRQRLLRSLIRMVEPLHRGRQALAKRGRNFLRKFAPRSTGASARPL
jgi:hypothetical protein